MKAWFVLTASSHRKIILENSLSGRFELYRKESPRIRRGFDLPLERATLVLVNEKYEDLAYRYVFMSTCTFADTVSRRSSVPLSMPRGHVTWIKELKKAW